MGFFFFSSVEVVVTTEGFQLRAELVQVHINHPSFPMLVEIRSNLVKSLAPGLWNPEECEDEEEQKQRCEDQEHVRPAEVLRTEPIGSEGNNSVVFDVRINPYRDILKAHANDEVGGPVAEAGHGHGCRPGTLGEELGHEEPGDGSGTDLEEGHEAVDSQHANVAHPGNTVLVYKRT